MRPGSLRAIVLSLAILAPTSTSLAVEASGTPYCDNDTTKAHYPHISGPVVNGKKTYTHVVAKSSLYCSNYVDVGMLMILWFCGENIPTGSEDTWEAEGCVQGQQLHVLRDAAPNEEHVRQIERVGATGYWANCTVFNEVEGTDSVLYRRLSPFVYLVFPPLRGLEQIP